MSKSPFYYVKAQPMCTSLPSLYMLCQMQRVLRVCNCALFKNYLLNQSFTRRSLGTYILAKLYSSRPKPCSCKTSGTNSLWHLVVHYKSFSPQNPEYHANERISPFWTTRTAGHDGIWFCFDVILMWPNSENYRYPKEGQRGKNIHLPKTKLHPHDSFFTFKPVFSNQSVSFIGYICKNDNKK